MLSETQTINQFSPNSKGLRTYSVALCCFWRCANAAMIRSQSQIRQPEFYGVLHNFSSLRYPAMTSLSDTFEEQIRVTQCGLFICRIETKLTSYRDHGNLISVIGHSLLCTLDQHPERGRHDNDRTPINIFQLSGTWLLSTGGDFGIPLHLRGLSVGRLIWSRIHALIPDELQGKVLIKGKLSRVDSTPDNSARRDALWKDVCAYSTEHKQVLIAHEN